MLRTMVKLSVAALALVSVTAGSALAQDYPNRPIRIIVGFDPGSSVDTNMRTIAPTLEKILEVPIVIENRPGAGGGIAWTNVSNARPDGYTLGSAQYPAIAGMFVTGGLPFNPVDGLEFLGNFVYDTNVVFVGKDSPYHSLADMIDYLKENPDGVSYGSNGLGSLDGLMALAIGEAAGVHFRQVLFNSDTDMTVAVLGGHVDAMAGSVLNARALIENGDVRAIGISGSERNPLLPDVPTFAEQGYPLAVNASSRGIVMPVGADPAIVSKLRDAIKAAMDDPEYLERAKTVNQVVTYLTPEQVRADVAANIEFIEKAVPK